MNMVNKIAPVEEAMSAISAAQRAADKAAHHLTRIPSSGAKSVRKASRQVSRVQEQLAQALSSIDARRELEALRQQVQSAESEVARLTQALRQSVTREVKTPASERPVAAPTETASPAKPAPAAKKAAATQAKPAAAAKRTTTARKSTGTPAKRTAAAKRTTAARTAPAKKATATPAAQDPTAPNA